MKKLATLLLAAGLVLSSVTGASAIDIKAKGFWWMAYDYAYGGDFTSKTRQGAKKYGSRQQAPHINMDNFEAWQRIMAGFDVVASESLSGSLMFEIGDNFWGNAGRAGTAASAGGALGTDGISVEVRHAYIDWIVPNSDLKLRMGLQLIALPSFTFESNVFIDDVAAISANYKINENAGITAFWMRPYNDNFGGSKGVAAGFMDNMDLFGLTVPLRFDGVSVTPWVMGGAMGPNVIQGPNGSTWGAQSYTNPRGGLYPGMNMINSQAAQTWFQFTSGMMPAVFSAGSKDFNVNYSTAIWAGLTGQVTAADPWRFAWDVNYGSLKGNQTYLDREGWIANALVEYKASWGTPGIYGWYSSGDDDNIHNGSERMPVISMTNIGPTGYSNFGFRSSPWVNNEGALGGSVVGFWGVGARIKNMSFIEGLSTTVLVNVFGGTNDPDIAKYITGRRATDGSGRPVYRNWTDFNSNYGVYLTQADTGIEINLNNTYKIYDNLSLLFELGYIHLWLDKGTWGKYGTLPGNTLNYEDAFKASVGFMYNF